MTKRCKGTGKAKSYKGCNKQLSFIEYNGKKKHNATFGLCLSCKRDWAVNTEEGRAWLYKQTTYKMKQKKQQSLKDFRERKRNTNKDNAMTSADNYFSRYIRLLFSVDGKCTCYTCGTILPIKEVDNGHYQKRAHQATRYNEDNCRPQCKICNGDTKHNGKQDEFRVNLVNEIGEERVEEVERLAKSVFKVNAKYYREVADEYRIKVNELQKKLKVKYW